jgi:fructose-bisphosphate aldolase class I
MDGDFTIHKSAKVTEKVLIACYKALSDHSVILEGTILKTNMSRSGSLSENQAEMEEVADASIKVLQHSVPCAVPGVAFLSGGMTEEDASSALNYINEISDKKPWNYLFIWKGITAKLFRCMERK